MHASTLGTMQRAAQWHANTFNAFCFFLLKAACNTPQIYIYETTKIAAGTLRLQ
jgi:hypothetical protein